MAGRGGEHGDTRQLGHVALPSSRRKVSSPAYRHGTFPTNVGVEGGFEAGEGEVRCGFARGSLRDHQGGREQRGLCMKRVEGETKVIVVQVGVDFRIGNEG